MIQKSRKTSSRIVRPGPTLQNALRAAIAPTIVIFLSSIALASRAQYEILPNAWRLTPSPHVLQLGTMPQGLSLSPDGKTLAIVESGVNAPELRLYETDRLRNIRNVALPAAFGKPVWSDDGHVLLAGAGTDSILRVDTSFGAVSHAADCGKGSWPAAVAVSREGTIACADDGDSSVTISGTQVRVGPHPSDLVYSRDGKRLYVCVRSTSELLAIDTLSKHIVQRLAVGLHPAAVALSPDGQLIFVAESDDDSIGVVDTRKLTRVSNIRVRMNVARLDGSGASPNALTVQGNDLFASLAGENAVALIRDGRVVERIPAGWYPTGVAVTKDGTLLVTDGKGEGMPANPEFDPHQSDSRGYVGDITVGSLRAISPVHYVGQRQERAETDQAVISIAPRWTPPPVRKTIIRPDGPIKHVIYVIKENRSYDQILGDIPEANGDAKLAEFGAEITPNEHALTRRFGIFDNAYTDAQVSPDGHNWTDAAFANDYVERFWPTYYGGRRDLYDFQDGSSPVAPHNGYLWDAAKRAGVSFRDYGEDIHFPGNGVVSGSTTFKGLKDQFDPLYVGWDISYSDLNRYAEWKREFDAYTRNNTLPAFEIVYLPDDHTAGTTLGKLTPQSYVARNDSAVGHLVQTVSRSRYWASSAIFIIEDDAQAGPDHVSDQRSTFYVASPYARGGLQHEHYSTVSVIHTIELLLGIAPLSVYDETARPLYDAFGTHAANGRPFEALSEHVSLDARNRRTAYGAALSAKLDFSRPDAAAVPVMNDILTHVTPK